jgi:hypothetical protein
MRYPVRTVCALVSIIGVAAILALTARHPSTELTDNQVMPESFGHWNDAVIQGQKFENQSKRAQERCIAKDEVAVEVLAGRLTLFEAAARFRGINESNPQAERWLTSIPYRDEPYELALCHSVIRRVELELESRGSGPEDDTLNRLESELAQHLQRHGRVCLPD